MPAGGPADAVGWLSMSRLPADHPWVTVRRPVADMRISLRPPVFFFSANYIPNSHGSPSGGPAGDWVVSRGNPANELIWCTPADHPPNFSCELKCLGRWLTSQGWALQEWLFGGWSPDFSPMGSKQGAKLAVRHVTEWAILLYCAVGLSKAVKVQWTNFNKVLLCCSCEESQSSQASAVMFWRINGNLYEIVL